MNVSDIQFRGDGENVFTIGWKEEFCIEVSYCNTTITFSISFTKKEPTIGFIGLENSILLKFYHFSVVQKTTINCSDVSALLNALQKLRTWERTKSSKNI